MRNATGPDTAATPTDLTKVAGRLAADLRPLVDRRVRVDIADAHTGWSFVAFTGTLTSVARDEGQLDIVLDGGAHSITLFADMVADLCTESTAVYIAYRAGNVVVTAEDG